MPYRKAYSASRRAVSLNATQRLLIYISRYRVPFCTLSLVKGLKALCANRQPFSVLFSAHLDEDSCAVHC